MATVQELITKYTFDVDTKPLESVQDKMTNLMGFAAKLAIGAGAAAASMFAFAKMTADAGDEALTTSQKLGVTVENLSRLQFAAKQSNIESGNFNTGLKFLAKNMSDASSGTGETADAFKKLGVNVKDANGKLRPTQEVLLQVADKVSKMSSGAEKTALSMKIFGRAGSDLIPLLNEGAAGIQKMMDRSDELGNTMSTELAVAGDEFNDSLDEMLGGLTGIRNMIGSKLIPIITPLIKQFTNFLIANRKIIQERADKFFKLLADFVESVVKGFKRLVPVLMFVIRNMEKIAFVMGTLMTLGLAYYIGTLIVALQGLSLAFLMVQIKAAAAWAVALAPIIGIGLAVLGLILIIEDLYLFLNDPEADTIFKGISEWFDGLPAWGMMLTSFLLTPLRVIVAQFKNIWEIMKLVTGNSSFGEAFGNIAKNQANVFMPDSNFSSQLGFNPAEKPAAQPTTPFNNSVMAAPKITNNINVGAGGDVSQIGKSVLQGTKDGMDESFRGAQRSFKKKGGY